MEWNNNTPDLAELTKNTALQNNPQIVQMERIEFKDITSESRQQSDAMKLKQWLANFINRNTDESPITTIFHELYMNICQHSNSGRGYITLAKSKSNMLTILGVDLGIGIVTRMKNYFTEQEFAHDAEWIKYALEDAVTTKTHIQNYGRGLNIIKTTTMAMNGSLEICSELAKFALFQGTEMFETLLSPMQGTHIKIELDLSYLEPKDTSMYNDDIDF